MPEKAPQHVDGSRRHRQGKYDKPKTVSRIEPSGAPEMPPPPMWLGTEWPADAVDEWRRVWSQPVASLWSADDGSAGRYLTSWARANCVDELPSAAILAEVRQAGGALLLDPKSRRLARVETESKPTASVAEIRARLLDGGA